MLLQLPKKCEQTILLIKTYFDAYFRLGLPKVRREPRKYRTMKGQSPGEESDQEN